MSSSRHYAESGLPHIYFFYSMKPTQFEAANPSRVSNQFSVYLTLNCILNFIVLLPALLLYNLHIRWKWTSHKTKVDMFHLRINSYGLEFILILTQSFIKKKHIFCHELLSFTHVLQYIGDIKVLKTSKRQLKLISWYKSHKNKWGKCRH